MQTILTKITVYILYEKEINLVRKNGGPIIFNMRVWLKGS